ncbi:MAG: FAD-dependent oxidoreductase, partial [Candidatus Dormibacteria bacterium]
YPEAFAKGALEGRVAVVGGGGIGVDIAHLASHGEEAGKGIARFRRAWGLARGRGPGPRSKRAVAVLQRGQRLGVGIGRSSRWAVLAELRHQGVEVLSGVAYRSIGPDGVRIRDGEGAARVVSAETVVIAAGQQPETSVADLARAAGVPLEVVGGARDVVGLDAVRAFAEGREAAARLSRPDGAAAGRARRRAAAL